MAGDGRQLHLFGEPDAAGRGPGIGPAAVPDDLRDVAAGIPPSVRFGTSSWSFPGWAGLVYDREASATALARSGLAAYARHPLLRAVGVDRTYYAPIPGEAFAHYAAAVPDGFRFLVKASGECTSPWTRDARGAAGGANDRYLDPAFAIEAVVGPYVEGLGSKAGALVFQFPPQGATGTREPARFAGELGAFLDALPRGPVYAVELRDRALLGDDYARTLREVGAVHCVSVHPRMPPPAEQLRIAGTDGPLVVRWMLHAGYGYEQAKERYAPFDALVDPDPATRSVLACAVHEAAFAGRDVILTANNKAEGSAPRSVFELARELVRRFDPEDA